MNLKLCKTFDNLIIWKFSQQQIFAFRFDIGLATVKCEFLICYQIVAEPANKGILQAPEYMFNEFVIQIHRTGISSLFVLDEIVINVPLAFGFKKFSPFYEVFNDKIGQLLANGIIKDLFKCVTQPEPHKSDDIGPQVLTMEHLGLGFVACLIPLVLAAVVFVIEIILCHELKSVPKK